MPAKISTLRRTTKLRIAPASDVKFFNPLKLNPIGSAYRSVDRKLSFARWSRGLFLREEIEDFFNELFLVFWKKPFVVLLKVAPI